MINWELQEDRVKFLDSINAQENKQRKAKSLQEYEIYNGNLNQYVEAYLTQQLSAKTVSKMPVISSIDICRRIADQEASVYKTSPKREFTDANDQDKEAIDAVYFDAMADIKLMKSNRYYKLQSQNLIQILPKEGKIEFRVLFPHNYDIVPDDSDPERAAAVIVSVFNKEQYVQGDRLKQNAFGMSLVAGSFRDNTNQVSADQDDYKSQIERYVVWTNDLNFIMDGKGKILSPDTANPIGLMPFVDVATDKDFNYFVDRGSQLSNFAVQYNAALSDLANIVRLQAYSQAVMTGAKESMPEHIVVGPTSIIKLAVDPNNPVPTDFKFVSPSPDLAGSIEFIEVLISNFLSSRGLSSATVSGKGQAEKFNSGVDRFLALIDRFEATKQDYALFEDVEHKVFKIIQSWLLAYSNTQYLNKKYNVSASFANSVLNVEFSKPEQVKSEAETLDLIQKKLEMGLIDDVEALMILNDIDETEAIAKLEKIRLRANELNQQGQVINGKDTQSQAQ